MGLKLVVDGSGVCWGTPPRLSGQQARQAAEGEVPDRLIGNAGRQMDLDPGFHLDDAGGTFDQAQPEGVELGDPPGGAPRHQRPQAPEQPVGAGVEEQPELVGGGLGARGAIGSEMRFPGLDMVFRLTAPAVEILVQRSAATMAEVGDDKAGIGSLITGLDAGDDAADPAPTAGGIEKFLEAADVAISRRSLESGRGARLNAVDMPTKRAGWGEAEDVVEAVRLAPVEHLRAGVMAVGADQDLRLRPVRPDGAERRKARISMPFGRFAGRRSAVTKRPSSSNTTIGWNPYSS